MNDFFLLLVVALSPPLSIFGQDAATGDLRVKVLLDQEPPGPPEIVADKHVEFCGATLHDTVLLVRDRAVQNTVVSIDWQGEPIDLPKPEPIGIQGRHCLMTPRIQTSTPGVFLELQSGDTVTHNPHGWFNDEKTVFNITLLKPELRFKRKLKWPGRYRVDCDTHTWMRAYVLVFDHPFHGVTGEDGVVTLASLPVGTYTVHVWHELLGEQSHEVTVEGGKEVTWEPTFALADLRPDKLRPKTTEPWPNK
jgi:plastocyanin